MESKAKLTPLDQKGEPIKEEICGAVFAARIRKYFEKHRRMEIEKWFHLVESQTVLGALQIDSYGYQTFFTTRVGEIQKAGLVQDWWWIPGDLNIADIITRGGTPEYLKEDYTWRTGKEFLKFPLTEWPKKSAADVAAHARVSVNRLQRKAFSAALTRSQANVDQRKDHLQAPQESVKNEIQEEKAATNPSLPLGRNPASWVIKNLLDMKKFDRLVKVIAWVWRAAKKWLEEKGQPKGQSKWEAVSFKEKKQESFVESRRT